ncbi:MAG TPA: hypothetical protein EYO16_01475 [Candidatus Marinimicrobia bacterium]|nr:hypothetical protein [Candidatus Neomarinimicrobiota bacterium]
MRLIFIFLFIALLAADIPPGYYDDAADLEGDSLLLALHNIIAGHNPYVYIKVDSKLDQFQSEPRFKEL